MSRADDLPDSDERGRWLEPLRPEERTWGMLCHLSSLLSFWVPYGTFVGPLLCWLLKKNDSRFVDAHGKQSLNFHISLFVYDVLLGVVLAATCGAAFFVVIPLWLIIKLVNVVMPVIAGVKANHGEMYHYPFTLNFLS